MTESQAKVASQASNEQQQHGQPIYGIQPPGGAPYATVGAYPPYYPYPPPPTDGNGAPQDPNGAHPGAYMMAFPPPPPGMIYAYPTAQGYPAMPFTAGMPLPAALVRPKRKQVKMACTNCAAACKRCDEGRPCERCCKYGVADSCQDGVRKERKKGIKRGPYKRKGKVNPETSYEGYQAEQNPEGFYPSYFYPPPGFVPIGPDGQPLQPDAANGAAAAAAAGQPGIPHAQYYPLHPAAYPPFAAYPHPGYPAVMAGHIMQQPGPPVEAQAATAEPTASISTAKTANKDDGATAAQAHTQGQIQVQVQEAGEHGEANSPAKSRKRGKGKEDAGGSSSNKKGKKGDADGTAAGMSTLPLPRAQGPTI